MENFVIKAGKRFGNVRILWNPFTCSPPIGDIEGGWSNQLTLETIGM